MKGKSLSRVRLLAIPWTAAHQAPPSMGLPKQEAWSGVPLPSLGSRSLFRNTRECSLHTQGGALPPGLPPTPQRTQDCDLGLQLKEEKQARRVLSLRDLPKETWRERAVSRRNESRAIVNHEALGGG